jgi:RNA polymerase sigma factor for flagellar operon FliA
LPEELRIVASNALDEQRVADACARFIPLVSRVVRSLASRLPRHLDIDDLLGAGALGLVKAVRRHLEASDDELRRQVAMRVRGAVLDHLRGNDPLSRHQRTAVTAVALAKQRLERRKAESDVGAVARELSMSVERAERIVHGVAAVQLTSLDDAPPIADEGEGPIEAMVERETAGRVRDALSAVPPRLRDILVMHYFRGASYATIARRLGVSRARISQLHTQALARMREQLAA